MRRVFTRRIFFILEIVMEIQRFGGTNTCFVFRLQYITENNLWKYFFGTEICKIIVLRAQKWYSK